jgi:hypothetical protein
MKHGRRAVRVDLGKDVLRGLAKLQEVLSGVIEKQ